MKKTTAFLIACVTCVIILIVILLFPLFIKNGMENAPAGNVESAATAQPELKIAATIFPLYDIAKNIAGDKARVEVIIAPGASPHTFEFSPEQIKKIIGTDVVFMIGHGLDKWIEVARNVMQDASFVTVDKGIEMLGADPHYWLDPLNAKIIGYNIAEVLSELSPEHKDYFAERAAHFTSRMNILVAESRPLIDWSGNKNIITMHDAWYYFAKLFGLEVLGVYEPLGGEEPTPRHLADLAQTVRANNIKMFFSEPQLAEEGVRAFVNDTGLEVRVLDPLGGVPGRGSYEELIRYNVSEIIR